MTVPPNRFPSCVEVVYKRSPCAFQILGARLATAERLRLRLLGVFLGVQWAELAPPGHVAAGRLGANLGRGETVHHCESFRVGARPGPSREVGDREPGRTFAAVKAIRPAWDKEDPEPNRSRRSLLRTGVRPDFHHGGCVREPVAESHGAAYGGRVRPEVEARVGCDRDVLA